MLPAAVPHRAFSSAEACIIHHEHSRLAVSEDTNLSIVAEA